MINGQMRAIISDPKFQAVEQLAEELCQKLNGESKVGSSEYETLTLALLGEGKVQGIRLLIQEMYAAARQDSQ